MPDAARDDPVLVGADEGRAIRRGIRMWSPIGVALQGDGGNGDRRPLGQPSLQIVVLRRAVRKAEPPPVVVDDDVDVVRVVEGCRAAIERGVVERPVRRRGLPDQAGELVPVLLVARAAALGGEVVLVPPGELGGRRERMARWPRDSRSGSRSPRHVRGSARATRRRGCWPCVRPSRTRRRRRSRCRARPSARSRRGRTPTAGRCGGSWPTGRWSCRIRAGAARSRGSPRRRASGRPRRSC